MNHLVMKKFSLLAIILLISAPTFAFLITQSGINTAVQGLFQEKAETAFTDRKLYKFTFANMMDKTVVVWLVDPLKAIEKERILAAILPPSQFLKVEVGMSAPKTTNIFFDAPQVFNAIAADYDYLKDNGLLEVAQFSAFINDVQNGKAEYTNNPNISFVRIHEGEYQIKKHYKTGAVCIGSKVFSLSFNMYSVADTPICDDPNEFLKQAAASTQK